MNLSPHFTFDELTRTGQTALQDSNRKEASQYLQALTDLCSQLLEPVRARFGPVSIHSAFRGPSVNAAIGGSKTSQHMKGEAADFHCPGATLDQVMRWIVHDSGLKYGQVILEGPNGRPTWIHISLGEPYRVGSSCRQALVFDGKSYTAYKG
jgi:zinc D-Ala-D-Ala carboxypeptidase